VQCDVAELVREAIEVARLRKPGTHVTLVADGPDSMAAQLDSNLLAQALLNLVFNAIDACGEAGTVTVRYGSTTVKKKRRTRIAVEDTGAGLPADVIDKVFDPFFTTKDEGTGLGLAIVNRIAEAHEGTIEVRNAEQGGAVFELTI